MSMGGAPSVTLSIDGQLVSARHGETLLQAIREHGVQVPTLCEFNGLSSVGAYRLCLVEVAGRPRPAAACVTGVEEGLEVHTTSERIWRLQRQRAPGHSHALARVAAAVELAHGTPGGGTPAFTWLQPCDTQAAPRTSHPAGR